GRIVIGGRVDAVFSMVLHTDQRSNRKRPADDAPFAFGIGPVDCFRLGAAGRDSAFSADGADTGISELSVLAIPGFDHSQRGERPARDVPACTVFYDLCVLRY